jgi:hypothetical protein
MFRVIFIPMFPGFSSYYMKIEILLHLDSYILNHSWVGFTSLAISDMQSWVIWWSSCWFLFSGYWGSKFPCSLIPSRVQPFSNPLVSNIIINPVSKKHNQSAIGLYCFVTQLPPFLLSIVSWTKQFITNDHFSVECFPLGMGSLPPFLLPIVSWTKQFITNDHFSVECLPLGVGSLWGCGVRRQTCWCFQLISIQSSLLCLFALPELMAMICFKSISILTVPKLATSWYISNQYNSALYRHKCSIKM